MSDLQAICAFVQAAPARSSFQTGASEGTGSIRGAGSAARRTASGGLPDASLHALPDRESLFVARFDRPQVITNSPRRLVRE